MKEVKIQIPEGYEIDKENSTFELIRFKLIEKPIEKFITYEDICSEIFKDGLGCYIDGNGDVSFNVKEYERDKNNATTKKQLERLLALNQLLNIAEYYNKLHTMTSVVYIVFTIMYSKIDKIYYISTSSTTYLCGIKVFFNRREDAQAVIDNPNFREILDTIYKE